MLLKRVCNDFAQLGFSDLRNAPKVFRRGSVSGGDIIMLLFVDEIVILGSSSEEIKFTVEALKKFYDVRYCDSFE